MFRGFPPFLWEEPLLSGLTPFREEDQIKVKLSRFAPHPFPSIFWEDDEEDPIPQFKRITSVSDFNGTSTRSTHLTDESLLCRLNITLLNRGIHVTFFSTDSFKPL